MARSWRIVSVYLQRHFVQRWHLLLIGLAGVLLLLDIFRPGVLYPLRQAGFYVVSPIQWLVSGLRAEVSSSANWLQALHDQSEQIARLEKENALLRQWYHFAIGLQEKNQRLEKYFSSGAFTSKMPLQHFVLQSSQAELINQQVRFDVPEDVALRLNAPVINEFGLIGRISALQETQASVMLLSHNLSRIPIRVGEDQQRALLLGRGKPIAVLEYVQYTEALNVAIGDVVKSSGLLGLLPAGLHVGTVSDIVKNKVFVKLAFNPQDLRYIGVISPELISSGTASAPKAEGS